MRVKSGDTVMCSYIYLEENVAICPTIIMLMLIIHMTKHDAMG